MADIGLLLIAAVFVDHVVLARCLDRHPVAGLFGRLDGAYGMALATGFALTLATALAWILERGVLVPLALDELRAAGFLLAIAVVVPFTGVLLHRGNPQLDRVLGVQLPLLAMNCAVLGVALPRGAAPGVAAPGGAAPSLLLGTVLAAAGIALAFGVALVLFSAMRERLEAADVPAAWRGAPIALVTAGLMSLAWLGLAGLVPGR